MDKLTKQEQYIVLNHKENIRRLCRKKEDILAYGKDLDGMPRKPGVSDPVGDLATATADIDHEIMEAITEYETAVRQLIARVKEVAPKDAWGMLLGHLDGKSYRKIAEGAGVSDVWVLKVVRKYCE